MNRLETIDGTNWRELVGSPLAVLMLSKTDCTNCTAWTEELTGFLAADTTLNDVRFGKMVLNQRGLIDFKRENPWLSEVDVLPFNVIYVNGERVKSFAGGGLERLRNRLARIRGQAGQLVG
jgi:hypothetical protein